ncbi:MAG: exodeoxyribonuclease VII small subunit [Actinomycetota bacterium]|nr:exodeoxyribonuclease VII small subunit [Actinomycetota bacterium]
MAAKEDGFDQLMDRLKEIVEKVQDVSLGLEGSLNLLEEGIDIANRCTERVDRIVGEEGIGLKEDVAKPHL